MNQQHRNVTSGTGVIACSPSSVHTDSHISNAYKYRSDRHALACLFWWVNLMRGTLLSCEDQIQSTAFCFCSHRLLVSFLRSHKLMSVCERYRRRRARVLVFADAFFKICLPAPKVSSPPRMCVGTRGDHCVGLRVAAQNAIQTARGRVLQGCDKREDLISRSQCAFRFS